MVHVFTYGSLMFDPVWSKVVNDTGYERHEAILQGFERKKVQHEVYPVIVPGAALSQVPGIVYFDVSSDDLERLDHFEGEYYFRKTVQVVTLDARMLTAEAYVLKPEFYGIIAPGEWDPVKFSHSGIHYFMHNYLGFEKQ